MFEIKTINFCSVIIRPRLSLSKVNLGIVLNRKRVRRMSRSSHEKLPHPERPLEGALVWRADDLSDTKWKFTLDADCLAEISNAVAHLRRHRVPTELLAPGDFDMPNCLAVMRGVHDRLVNGPGFALVDRLPMDSLTKDEAKAVYWILAGMVCRPVAQKLDGTMIYDVHDTGAKAAAGSGVRPDKTNIDLTFHNDNSYNNPMPDFVALLCLKPAKSGGISRLMSFETAFNSLLERHKNALSRLFEPFVFDRQKEHFEGDTQTISEPIFVDDGGIRARLGIHQVRNGYEMLGQEMDTRTRDALAALEDVFSEADLQIDFTMEAGQVQFVNNLAIGHSRTEFEDFEMPEERRHLVRLWLRSKGDRSYFG